MKYKICIKYPSGYRYRRVVEVDGEEAAQAIANRLLDRCNAGFGNLPACRIESVELVMPIDEMLHVIRERAKNTAKLKAMTGGFPSQEQIDISVLLEEVDRLKDVLDKAEKLAKDSVNEFALENEKLKARAEKAEKRCAVATDFCTKMRDACREQIDNNDFDGLYDFPEGRWKACNAILDKLQGVTI